MRKHHSKRKTGAQQPIELNADQPQVEGEEFNPRDYLLSTPNEREQESKQEDFDPRAWFLLDAVEPETEAMRIQRQLSDAGLPALHVEAAADDGAFEFRFWIENPETYTTEQVHDRLAAALEQIGYTLVIIQIATQLDAGMTSGTLWVARQ
jgi:hypothetical protein